MPYITREDGERFVIPSYRDVLSVKKESFLRKEILLLSASYGEYIAIQRKAVNQYEVAFSTTPGYLLGETIWHYFKRPPDLIYCEEIPNTSEAILVIVRSGIVYIDGSFTAEAIPEELIAFHTQQNNFEIYVHGNVPISQIPGEGKFAFDPNKIKSFTILEKPIFPTLPTVKTFQLQLVDAVLKSKGIGVLPVKKILTAVGLLGLIWLTWSYFSTHKKELPQVIIQATDPFAVFNTALMTPSPSEQINWLAKFIWQLSTIPGWYADSLEYTDNLLRVSVKSMGGRTNLLDAWAKKNYATVEIASTGFFLNIVTGFQFRRPPDTISSLNNIVSLMVDDLSYIIPGNSLSVGALLARGSYNERQLTINFNDITPTVLGLIGQKLKNLPLVLTKVSITIDSTGNITGSIILRALGN